MKRLISFFSRLCEAFLPDAFVFCLLLTLIVYGAGLMLTPHSPIALIDFWAKDFWNLNAFAMQMVFVLISGHMLASAPIMKRALIKVSRRVKNERMALLVLSLFSMLACWLNWGFGLIVSGILAIELAKKLKRVDFGLFIATAYSGFLVWHGGLSGSIPLKVAGKDEILTKIYPEMSISLSETIFSPINLLILGLLLLSLPLVSLKMMGTGSPRSIVAENDDLESVKMSGSFRDFLEFSPWFNRVFFLFFLVFLVRGFLKGESLDINRLNFVFLFVALWLHRTPKHFLSALSLSLPLAAGIIIQFPFYAGIMGLMQYSGLADIVSQFFVTISTPKTLAFWTFLSGGLVNFFVPSGGGQWVVQGPIVLKAAQELGVSPARVIMALAWGDAWTNMIQPFWALPLLAMARLELKEIMGHCLIFLFVSGVIIGGAFLLI